MTKKETLIQLPRKITIQLLHLAQLSPNQEVCGLIGAKNDIANTCYPVDNTSDYPETLFQLDSKQQISAISTMRAKNEDFFAIYHSHPTSPAFPSDTDVRLSAYPDALYLIISLSTKGILEMRGFKIIEGSVKEITLSLMPD